MSDRQHQAHVLVVGAGPAGLRAALDLADLGVRVTLVEKRPAPGGTLTQLDVQYPTVDCGACQVQESLAGPPWAEPKCLRTGVAHELVTTLTSTAVTSAERGPDGGLEVVLEQRPRLIDPARCTGCGDCAALCPVSAPSEHEAGTCERRAVYRPHRLTDPPAWVIDDELCTRCGDCLPACPEGAIDLEQQPTSLELEADAVVLAPGFAPFDAALQPQWSWGRDPAVVTALELERMVRPSPDGGLRPLVRPGDGGPVERVAFVQCVGSRDTDRPWCSGICCMHALKEAILLREELGVAECDIYAIDLRCVGKGYEQTAERAKADGVRLIHSRPAAVEPGDDGRPRLRVEPPGERQRREPYDLIVLSVGLTPPASLPSLARSFGFELAEQGFVRSGPTSAVETTAPGVFVCGAAAGPADLPWSITTASQAALAAAAHAKVPRATARRQPSPATARPRPNRLPLTDIPPASELERPAEQAVSPKALILGAGPAGLSAARAIARAGFPVVLVDRAAEPGGNLLEARRLLDGSAPAELLATLLADIEAAPGEVELLLGWELEGHRGGPGDLTATLRDRRTDAIRKIRHGALIVATGAAEMAPEGRYGWRPGADSPVVTQRELERRLAEGESIGENERPRVVMIQCVGSREPERPVCSRVCCHEAIKNALWLFEQNPGAQVILLHRDLRAVGFDELAYERARRAGLVTIRVDEGERPRVEPTEAGATVTFTDPLLGRPMRIDADMVVLSAALEPNLTEDEAAQLGLELGLGGFLREANVKFRPVEASRRGVLVAGTALTASLTPEAMAQGEAAALRALAVLSRERLVARPGAAAWRPKWCAACGLCVEACPASARELGEVDGRPGAVVYVGLCQGCGGCAAACPSGCTDQPELDAKGVMTMIDRALEVLS